MTTPLPQVPLPKEATRSVLRKQALDWALAHGLVVLPRATFGTEQDGTTVTHAPFSLVPTPFPRACFTEAMALQPMINVLVDRVSQDDAFLSSIFDRVAQVDPFTGRIYRFYQETKMASAANKLCTLGILRSDYLLHRNPGEHVIGIRQVEVNTIAASFATLSMMTSQLHRYLHVACPRSEKTGQLDTAGVVTTEGLDGILPLNDASRGIARSILEARQVAFGMNRGSLLMVVQPGERNMFDQRGIEHALMSLSSALGGTPMRTIRCTLKELGDEAIVDRRTNELTFRGELISVVYYRSGYAPEDYTAEGDENLAWEGRRLVEVSSAITCPSAAYHLVGAKKVQQELARPGVLERFIPSSEDVARLHGCFAGLYSLDTTNEGDEAAMLAMASPTKYVMKPQREGGGNNIYGEDIPKALGAMTREERSGYILMDLIRPPRATGLMMREGRIVEDEVVSELGVYGTFIRLQATGEVITNYAAGHLLRTKGAEVQEGGVAVGFAVMDSPYLF